MVHSFLSSDSRVQRLCSIKARRRPRLHKGRHVWHESFKFVARIIDAHSQPHFWKGKHVNVTWLCPTFGHMTHWLTQMVILTKKQTFSCTSKPVKTNVRRYIHNVCMCGVWACVCVCMCQCARVCAYVYINRGDLSNLIERISPPQGGFLFTMFPHQEPCVRGPPSKNLVQILRGGSSYTRFLMREHSK